MNLVQSAVWDGIKGCFSEGVEVSFRGAPSWTLVIEPVPGEGLEPVWVHLQPALRVRLMAAPLNELPRMTEKLGARLKEEMRDSSTPAARTRSGVLELEESWLDQ